MKKKVVTFGPVKVTKINKKGKGFKVLLSHGRPTRNMFPPGNVGTNMYLNASSRWARHQKQVPKPATFTNANKAARALRNASERAEKLHEEIQANNTRLKELARILKRNPPCLLPSCTNNTRNSPRHGGNNNNNLYS